MSGWGRPIPLWLLALAIGLPLGVRAQPSQVILFGLTNSWKYNQVSSYDGIPWTQPAFNDSGLPGGRGVLAVEDANNPFVVARTNTALTLGRLTYYFRTHFTFTNNPSGAALTFSNIVDDGAIYYLNGVEISRFSMPASPPAVTYSTAAANHEATAFDVFTVSGSIVETNLLQGDNVLAVEVHQSTSASTDIVFGLGLSATIPDPFPPPTLRMPPALPVYGYTTVNAFPGMNFGAPVAITAPPGETNRLFIVDKAGRILVITNLANPTLTLFMDLGARVVNVGESGLLGLAFHPDYANPTNRFFYVFYSVSTNTQGTNQLHQRLSRFQTSAANPNQASTATEQALITQADPASNHNGGDIHFGADGYLYVSVGDGGLQYDGSGNSQRIDRDFFSAILRIDVDKRFGNPLPNVHPASSANYAIPSDNPFIGRTVYNGVSVNPANIRTEFYAIGFRNPWRFSFDGPTGFLYCGDVGQDTYEEVDIVTKGGNYGWAYREGLHPGYKTGTALEPLINPIQEYAHSANLTNQGNAVVGGVVYRGTRLYPLRGAYVFGDNGSGNIWALRHDGTNTIPFVQLTTLAGVSAFGTDPANDDVLLANVGNGSIFRLAFADVLTGSPLPPTLHDTGAFTNLTSLSTQTAPLTPNAGMVGYDINVPFWSDNARKSRWFFRPNTNLTVGFSPNANWSFPTGVAWVKHFDLEITNGVASSARRLETRILVKNTNGVYGVTYRWGNSTTNASLVPESGMDEAFAIYDGGVTRTQIWHYPGRAECVICHTPVGGHALGFNTAQLNRDFNYGAGATNQIVALAAAGYLTGSVSNVLSLRSLVPATDETVSLEWRVRSYLAANCAQCHQPGGAGLGFWNASPTNTTANAGLIHGPLNNNGGNPNNRVVVPGAPFNSMLLTRISTRGPGQMPPLASSLLDTQAMALVRRWITDDLPAYQTFAQWQTNHFGSTNAPNALATADPDGDGQGNFGEFLTGTDPNAPGDAWRIGISHAGTAVDLLWPNLVNRSVEIQWTTNLGAAASWRFLNVPANHPFFPAQPGTSLLRDPATQAESRFYRARVSEP
jgi:uncharacterized repeat protein (TIGR03806 family)